jgi:CheY-like chemotaxis protein
MLLNIVLNANDAMPRGGELSFETENVELDESSPVYKEHEIKTGAHVRLTISDTGEGMSDDTKKHIFEPFFTTKEPGKGLGMGLAAVYGVVRNHGGAIDVDSRLGMGTTFKIYFPAVDGVEEQPPETQDVTRHDTKSGTILIVDDEHFVRETADKMLRSLGYSVMTAESGQEAVARYIHSREIINLVLIDMIMPGMDGTETFIKLKEVNPEVKVILSSGYTLDRDAQKLVDEGLAGFIQKPFNLRALTKTIAEVM